MQLSSTTITDTDQLKQIIERNDNPLNQTSIISEARSAKEYTIPVPGEIVVSHDDDSAMESRTAMSWWNRYGYGIRVDDYIYCIFNRKTPSNFNNSNHTPCVKRISAKRSESTTFIRHWENAHAFTKEKRKITSNSAKLQCIARFLLYKYFVVRY